MTNYVSTRGEGGEISYNDAILQGQAPDKGLYIPAEYPQVDEAFIRGLEGLSYEKIFTAVNGLFVGDDISAEDQRHMAEAAYTREKFPDAKDGNITPLTWLTDRVAILQLSLGPTAAFKDMAMQPMSQHLNYVLQERDEYLRMLGATSGDTGSSAEAAMKGLARVSLMMLSPVEGMSEFQKMQMAALSGGNIQNLSVDGSFDDCQDMVKALKDMPEFADLGAVNSINWGRIAAQVAYYFAGYLQAVNGEVGKQVDYVVPSGNFGNVLAGYIAKKMGLPIRRLIVATNENSVLDQVIQTGVYKKSERVVTSSPSMDISKASNYERIVPDILISDPRKVRAYMEQFEKEGRVAFSDFGLPAESVKNLGFDSGISTHEDRIYSIKWAQRQGMTIDPHTADAVTVAMARAWNDSSDKTPMICMATALPVKFEKTMQEALGFVPERPSRFVGLEDNARRLATVGFAATLRAADLDGLATWVRRLG